MSRESNFRFQDLDTPAFLREAQGFQGFDEIFGFRGHGFKIRVYGLESRGLGVRVLG